MDWQQTARRCLEADRVLDTQHARLEMKGGHFGEVLEQEVFEAACSCDVLEDYPQDAPYPSALLFGETSAGRPLHLVCAYNDSGDQVIVITVYHPDPDRWEGNRTRK